MLEKFTAYAFCIACLSLAFLLLQREKFVYIIPVLLIGLIAFLGTQTWFQGFFKQQILSMVLMNAEKYGKKLDEFQLTAEKMQSDLEEQHKNLVIQKKQIDNVADLVENIFSRTQFESPKGWDTNRVFIMPLDGDERLLLIKLEYVPIKGSIQCIIGGVLLAGGNTYLSPMFQYKNIAYTWISGDGAANANFVIQYVKDIRNTNLIQKVEYKGKDLLFDGVKTKLVKADSN